MRFNELAGASDSIKQDPYLILLVSGVALLLLIVLPIIYLFKVRRKYNPKRLDPKFQKFLYEFPFYVNLSLGEQNVFCKRMQLFINTKQFITRSNNLHFSDRMAALIAATAIEITFGYENFQFDHFSRILIYPTDYYSRITKQYHRGEVNPRGFIVLSWKAFEEGHINKDDGINLGIHEMAHALKLENKIVNSDYNFIRKSDLEALNYEFEKFKRKGGSAQFLRKYAGTNIHEFFAVGCENFFERPNEFKKAMPSSYNVFSDILRQDLAQKR